MTEIKANESNPVKNEKKKKKGRVIQGLKKDTSRVFHTPLHMVFEYQFLKYGRDLVLHFSLSKLPSLTGAFFNDHEPSIKE